MFNLYVIGIDYVQSSQECACSMFWLSPIFTRYSNQGNDKRLMFLKKEGRDLGTFLWTKSTNKSTFI